MVETCVQRRDRRVERRPDAPIVPHVELACNPSSFAVYCGVRRSVLASFMQQLSASLCRDVMSADIDSDDDDDAGKSPGVTPLYRDCQR